MMHAEDIRTYCLQKKEVTESFPFDEHTLVFKVAGKMFLLLPLDETLLAFNAKNTPEKSIELREQFTNIQPGFHMNKLHHFPLSEACQLLTFCNLHLLVVIHFPQSYCTKYQNPQ